MIKRETCLHFLSFLDIDIMWVIEFFLVEDPVIQHAGQYLITWRHRESRHKQPWYSFSSTGIFRPQHQNSSRANHEDVIKWKHFPRNWPFLRGIHRSPVNSTHKGQWRGALMFSLICAWLNGEQCWSSWFETPSLPLWRHCNALSLSLSMWNRAAPPQIWYSLI